MSNWWVNNLIAVDGPKLVVAWTLWMIGSLVLHELAHGWTAIRCGDDTPYHSGHMTWNPVVHMGMPSVALFVLTGLAFGRMPIDPTRLRRTWHEALVAFAGPAMDLLLAAFAIVVAAVALRYSVSATGQSRVVAIELFKFMWFGAVLNILLALFNLVPVPPLDGWRVLGVLVPSYRRLFDDEKGMALGLIMLGVLFFYGGQFLMPLSADMTRVAVEFLAGLMGAPARP